jgi:HD-GYP domain-containing protein (c-di-GMP phosphodiesterase class II)
MKTHTKIGSDLIKRIRDLKSISEGILYHHENWDGTGYPEGISGEDIPLVSRIIRVVDSYDAMISTRTYNVVKSRNTALEEIKNNSGTMYDPEVVEIFLEIIENEDLEGEEKDSSLIRFA